MTYLLNSTLLVCKNVVSWLRTCGWLSWLPCATKDTARKKQLPSPRITFLLLPCWFRYTSGLVLGNIGWRLAWLLWVPCANCVGRQLHNMCGHRLMSSTSCYTLYVTIYMHIPCLCVESHCRFFSLSRIRTCGFAVLWTWSLCRKVWKSQWGYTNKWLFCM